MSMNSMTARILAGLALIAGAWQTGARAQPPAPAGHWTFNAAQSDDPRNRTQTGDTMGGEPRAWGGGGRRGGMGGGRGGFGGGRGGRSGGAGGGGGGGGMSDEQRARMRQTMQLAFQAPTTLTIAQSDSTLAFTADTGAALVLYANGRNLKQTMDGGGEVEIKAHWQGNDFVVERKGSGGGKVTEGYLRAQDGKQLFVIVSLDTGRMRAIAVLGYGSWNRAALPPLRRPARLLDPVEQLPRLALHPVGERLDIPAATHRIHRLGHTGLVRQNLLGAERQRGALLGRERQRLVVRIGVQRLRAAQHRRQRLDRHAHHVVLGLLRREGGAARLRMDAQPARGVVRLKALLHEPRPQPPGGPELGDFFEQVGERGEEN